MGTYIKAVLALVVCTLIFAFFLDRWSTVTFQGQRFLSAWKNGNFVNTQPRHALTNTTNYKLETLTPEEENEELLRRLSNATENKVILLWQSPPWQKNDPHVDAATCGKCEVTRNRSLINDNSTKAVVYYSFVGNTGMPSADVRPRDQLHVFWMLEPPTRHMRKASDWIVKTPLRFNATISYRRLSDFFGIYEFGSVRSVVARHSPPADILNMKKRLGLSLVSNCGTTAGATLRIKVLKKIQALNFSLEGYGRCFTTKENFPKGNEGLARMKTYKFYFSFENSYHCRDYITEKVFRNGFQSFAIPVVWGAMKEEYEALLPEKSFIYAEDFNSMESLVEYLQYLDKNDTAYLEYFGWHSKPLKPLAPSPFCQLCRALHGINIDDRHIPDYNPLHPPRPTFTDGIAKRTLPLISDWIYKKDHFECTDKNISNWEFYKKWKLGP